MYILETLVVCVNNMIYQALRFSSFFLMDESEMVAVMICFFIRLHETFNAATA